MKGTRERRVTLALKWKHLDNLDVDDIIERFDEEGFGRPAASTVRNYLNEQPAEEVLEQIEKQHANTRLQAAERYERLYQDAREDLEELAVDDEPVKRVAPATGQVDTDRATPMQYPDWERVEPGDDEWPEWATPRDLIVRFTNEFRQVHPGETYPLQSVDGTPKYTTEFLGLRRDVPDLQKRQGARREMASHLQQKADVLGVYKDRLELEGSLETESTVALDDETKDIAR